jgi:hypothetical protein
VWLFVFDRGSHFSMEALLTQVFKTFANLLTTQREKFICVVHLENMIHCLIRCQLVHWLCRFSFFAGIVTSDVAFSEDYKAYLYLFTSIDWISRQDEINV